MRRALLAILMLWAAILLPAQTARPASRTPVLDRLEKMSPAERKAILDKLPAARRHQLEQKLKRYDAMTPAQRARARHRLEWFRRLPPERQEATRQLYKRFNELPRPRQIAVRSGVKELQALDEAARRTHVESDSFRARYSPEELEMVEGFSAATQNASHR